MHRVSVGVARPALPNAAAARRLRRQRDALTQCRAVYNEQHLPGSTAASLVSGGGGGSTSLPTGGGVADAEDTPEQMAWAIRGDWKMRLMLPRRSIQVRARAAAAPSQHRAGHVLWRSGHAAAEPSQHVQRGMF